MEMEAETGMRLPRARSHPEPAEAGGDKEGFSPGDLRGRVALPTPHSQTPDLQTVRESICVVLNHPGSGNLFWPPRETGTERGGRL